MNSRSKEYDKERKIEKSKNKKRNRKKSIKIKKSLKSKLMSFMKLMSNKIFKTAIMKIIITQKIWIISTQIMKSLIISKTLFWLIMQFLSKYLVDVVKKISHSTICCINICEQIYVRIHILKAHQRSQTLWSMILSWHMSSFLWYDQKSISIKT